MASSTLCAYKCPASPSNCPSSSFHQWPCLASGLAFQLHKWNLILESLFTIIDSTQGPMHLAYQLYHSHSPIMEWWWRAYSKLMVYLLQERNAGEEFAIWACKWHITCHWHIIWTVIWLSLIMFKHEVQAGSDTLKPHLAKCLQDALDLFESHQSSGMGEVNHKQIKVPFLPLI